MLRLGHAFCWLINLCVYLCSKGKHEDITREYFEAKTRYDGIMESLRNVERYSEVRVVSSSCRSF